MPKEDQNPFIFHYGNSLAEKLWVSVIFRWFKMCFQGNYDYIVIIYTGNFNFSEYDVYFAKINHDSERDKTEAAFQRLAKAKFPSLFMILPINWE